MNYADDEQCAGAPAAAKDVAKSSAVAEEEEVPTTPSQANPTVVMLDEGHQGAEPVQSVTVTTRTVEGGNASEHFFTIQVPAPDQVEVIGSIIAGLETWKQDPPSAGPTHGDGNLGTLTHGHGDLQPGTADTLLGLSLARAQLDDVADKNSTIEDEYGSDWTFSQRLHDGMSDFDSDTAGTSVTAETTTDEDLADDLQTSLPFSGVDEMD